MPDAIDALKAAHALGRELPRHALAPLADAWARRVLLEGRPAELLGVFWVPTTSGGGERWPAAAYLLDGARVLLAWLTPAGAWRVRTVRSCTATSRLEPAPLPRELPALS